MSLLRHTPPYLTPFIVTNLTLITHRCIHGATTVICSWESTHGPTKKLAGKILRWGEARAHTYTNIIEQTNNSAPHTGWRRCIGCLKLQVNFRKRATNYRALLRKNDLWRQGILWGSSPPCMTQLCHVTQCVCVMWLNVCVSGSYVTDTMGHVTHWSES